MFRHRPCHSTGHFSILEQQKGIAFIDSVSGGNVMIGIEIHLPKIDAALPTQGQPLHQWMHNVGVPLAFCFEDDEARLASIQHLAVKHIIG